MKPALDRRALMRASAAAIAALGTSTLQHIEPLGVRTALAADGFDFSAGSAGCMRVAFMFNVGAGYEPAYGIFDTLGTYGLASSMFVMGWLAEQNPELVQAMDSRGHIVGSHGYVPPELPLRSDDDIAWDLQAAADAIAGAIGHAPVPWLTPFAASSDERVRGIASALGWVTVGRSVDSADWSPDATADSIYSRVMNGVFDGGIIELHVDASRSIDGTAVALPWILSDLYAQGYQVVNIQQMSGGC